MSFPKSLRFFFFYRLNAQTDCFNLCFSDHFRTITFVSRMEFMVGVSGTPGTLSYLAWIFFYGRLPDVCLGSYPYPSATTENPEPDFIDWRSTIFDRFRVDFLRPDSNALRF